MSSRIASTPVVLALGLVTGCGGSSAAPPPATPPSSSTPTAGDVAPYPYTVAEIRSSCHERTLELGIQKAGAPLVKERWVFQDVDADTTNITTTTLDANDRVLGAPKTEASTWAELHEHGAFPRASTTLSDDTVTVPSGTFPSTRYQVTTGDMVKTVWFAKSLPGPPVKMVVTKAGQPILEMTLLATRAR